MAWSDSKAVTRYAMRDGSNEGIRPHRAMKYFLTAASALWLSSVPLAAQPVTSFGGMVPCQTWLTVPGARNEGNVWILGFWSGMNVQAALDKKSIDTGHTMQWNDVISEVERVCRQDLTKPMSVAAAIARAKTFAERR